MPSESRQVSAKTQKNRRYRSAKISEYRLRRVVECFARDMTAAETVKATRLSAPTISLIFHRLRERMRDHGLFVPQFDGKPHLPGAIDPRHRGVPEHLHDLYVIEKIHRVLCAQHLKGFARLPASNPKNVEKATRLLRYDNGQAVNRYQILEAFKQPDSNTNAPKTKLFDPRHIKQDSDILINELHTSPHAAFFVYIWGLLHGFPL